MIFCEKRITLKNGICATLKTPEIGDGALLLSYIKTVCGETDFLLRSPEDWDGVTVENEDNWIRSGRESADSLIISCYIDGAIVGTCDIGFNSGRKTSHRAAVGIAILKDYWGLGIGSAMFDEMLSAAGKRPGTEIVELEFIEGNDRGLALYRKFGFEVVAVRPNAFKQSDCRLAREYLMQKVL